MKRRTGLAATVPTGSIGALPVREHGRIRRSPRRRGAASRATSGGEDPRSLGDVQAHPEREGQRRIRLGRRRPGGEARLRRVGIHVEVPLGRRRRVSRNAEGAAHERPAAEQGRAAAARARARGRGSSSGRGSRGGSRRAVAARRRRSRSAAIPGRQRAAWSGELGMADAARAVRLLGRLERLDERPLRPRVRRAHRRGRRAPARIGCCPPPARTGTFPATQVTATSSISGEAHA